MTVYILSRKRGVQQAEYPLSFNDCFAVSNARRENAIIVTGDPEFKNVEHFVEIEWLNK